MPEEKPKEKSQAKNPEMVAIILIRGLEGTSYDLKNTLKLLNLHKKHFCALVEQKPSTKGMLQKVKDFVTWGNVNKETITMLYDKRGEEFKGSENKKSGFKIYDGKKFKPFFRLAPPKGGYERGGIKKSFKLGGVLGDRKEAINDLIKKMI